MLRPYQIKAIDQIRNHYAQGEKKVLLHLDTGGGKTVIFSEILKASFAKNKKAIVVVRGRKLVDQAHKRLLRECVPHGVLMAGHWNKNHLASIQICSIDTLRARKLLPDADLIVFDEAHNANSQSYRDFISAYPNAYMLAVTATPYVEDGLRHIANTIVRPVNMNELIAQGYLVPPVYYAPVEVDTSKVRISQSTKDYVTSDLEMILDENSIVGNLVDNWKKFGENRPTLVFAVSIKHSKHIAQMFQDAGITCEHCDADTKDAEREAIMNRFVSRETSVITNVGIFCTGVDIPPLSCIVMARPTKSYNLYIQQAGRGTRPFEGKPNFILLDHAGNVLRHGFINNQPECNLDGNEEQKARPIKTCKQCFAVFDQFQSSCPYCHSSSVVTRNGSNERMADEVSGTLAKIDSLPIKQQATIELKRLKKIRKEKKYKRGWLYHQMKDKFGDDIATVLVPRMQIPDWVKNR